TTASTEARPELGAATRTEGVGAAESRAPAGSCAITRRSTAATKAESLAVLSLSSQKRIIRSAAGFATCDWPNWRRSSTRRISTGQEVSLMEASRNDFDLYSVRPDERDEEATTR